MEKNQRETRSATIWLGDDGILRVVMRPKIEITRFDAEENHLAIQQIMGGSSLLQFVDISRIRSADHGARSFSPSNPGQAPLALAMLVGSPISRAIGNFYLGLNKPDYPLKLFTFEAKAIEWLKTFEEAGGGD